MSRTKDLWTDRANQRKYAGWLMHYSKPYIGRIAAILFFDILSLVIGLVMVQVTKQVIDQATAGNSFWGLMGLYLGMIVLTEVVSILTTLLSAVLTERFSFGIRLQIYDKILHSHWMEVTKFHTGDLMTRLTSDAGNIADGIIGTIPTIIQLLVELLLVFFMLFYYSPVLALLALLIAPVAALVSWWLGKKLKRLQVKVQQSEANYRSFLQESMANILIVKSFANETYSHNRLNTLREERFKWVYKKTKFSAASSTAMSAAFEVGYIIAFAYGAYQIYQGQITYGTMTVFLTLVNRVQAPVLSLAQQIPKIVMILASAGRVMELQDLSEEDHLQEQKVSVVAETGDQMQEEEDRTLLDQALPIGSGNHRGELLVGVKVENLSFHYIPEEEVLTNCSFRVEPGEFVAIIGESGIGKTTLIRLLMSFMKDYQGSISYDLTTLDQKQHSLEPASADMRRFLAYVPQGNTLFSGTIRENIRMGNLEASQEDMEEALKLASGYDFVMGLPDGLDTRIGERGHGLSEGQAQRIAIARAFVRKAPLLILDEATSALDENTEMKVLKGLLELKPRPTCIVITHRKSILNFCDRQILIKDKHLTIKDL